MANYLLIEARDPFDSTDVDRIWSLAEDLAGNGDSVTVYLVQNGVLPARSGSSAAGRLQGLASSATVLADDFSLRERGIKPGELVEGITVSGMDQLVDLMVADGTKVIWH